jgi:hypothetical protein
MKLQYVCFLALCAAVTALPSDTVVPEVSLVETSMEVSYSDAKATITNLMQQGKDDSACRDMAKATADEVKAAVDSQQKALAAMANGDECNDEGQGLINKANQDQMDADKAKSDAQTALTTAKKDKFNFGDFAYDDLQEGQCGTFFNSQTWKDAKGKVNAAQTTYNTMAAEATAAAKAVETAKAEAKDLVTDCKCKAKKALDTALKTMNENAKDANQKAWNKSYHMQCVLDGKTTQNCNVPSLPVVTAVPYGQGVKDACGCTASDVYSGSNGCGAPGNMDGYLGSGYPNRLFGKDAGNWGHTTALKDVVWQCGDGAHSSPKQQFMLSKIYIGSRLPTLDDWKKCSTKKGWRPLCDYSSGCLDGAAKEAIFPNKCSNYVHNNQFYNTIKHEGGSTSSAWQNHGYSDWTHSLRYCSGMRSDGSGYGYACSSYPTSNWAAAGNPNTIMCILPLNSCEKGECGFQ